MLTYEVIVNDEKKCTVGIDEQGVLTILITGWGPSPKNRLSEAERTQLAVSGLVGENNMEWLEPMSIRKGDIVIIRVGEGEDVDEPRPLLLMDQLQK